MCNPTSSPSPVREVSVDGEMVKYYGLPSTKALAGPDRFVLVDCDGNTVVTKNLKQEQVSSLVHAWRQGQFEGSTGKDLAELIEIFSN